MERITYRKTLDVHKNGVQFMLQGFETADKLSRVIEISFMASGDAVDLPLERMVAMMYVTSPGASEPSINACRIEDNKIVYDVLPIAAEGITTMQLKLIETSPDGIKRVLASPKFAVEVSRSEVDDDGEELSATFTALEGAIAKATETYLTRLLRVEIDETCVFRAFYADGTIYETDVMRDTLSQASSKLDLTKLVENSVTRFTSEEVANNVIALLEEEGIILGETKLTLEGHAEEIDVLTETQNEQAEEIDKLKECITPIEKGGTAIDKDGVRELATQLEAEEITEDEYKKKIKSLARDSLGIMHDSKSTTLESANWNDGKYSFEEEYPAKEYDIDLCLCGDNLSTEQKKAFLDADIVGCSDVNAIRAFGEVPTIDIPIILKVVRK